MSLEYATMPLSCKQIAIMEQNDKFDFNYIVQRGLVWERTRKSAFIESLIIGFRIPDIYCRRYRDESESKNKKANSRYVITDGKQRITTIASFIQNMWKLSTLKPVTFTTYEGEDVTVDISDKTFDELPEELKDRIKDTHIVFIYFENITPEEERELFRRLNAGKPLSTKARVLSNCLDLEKILNIGDHSIFKNMMTENALSQKDQATVVMKIWAMLNKDINEVSFEGKFFNPLVEETIISDTEKSELLDTFDYMESVHSYILESENADAKKLAKKFYTETHLVSMVPFVKQARNEGTDENMFGDFVINFFTSTDTDEMTRYNDATLRGSARNENIKIRNEILKKSFDSFFEVG